MSPRRILFTLTLATFLLLSAIASFAIDDQKGLVSWVYDGDTLEVAGWGTVRLIGIDTPERDESPRDNFYRGRGISPETLRAISEQARRFNIEEVKGKRVHLAFGREKKDRHERTLAFVYLPDGRMLNLLLIEKGFAAVYRKFDFDFKDDFLAAEENARKDRRGLWREIAGPHP